jgi:hypothetical protein
VFLLGLVASFSFLEQAHSASPGVNPVKNKPEAKELARVASAALERSNALNQLFNEWREEFNRMEAGKMARVRTVPCSC